MKMLKAEISISFIEKDNGERLLEEIHITSKNTSFAERLAALLVLAESILRNECVSLTVEEPKP